MLGAAVRESGAPSAALARRIECAIALAHARPQAKLLLTGGRGRHGPAEADVMAERALARGVEPERLMRERHATTTGESARLCARLLRDATLAGRGSVARVVIVTDAYHQRRSRFAFGRMGLGPRAGIEIESHSPAERPGGSLPARARRVAREWLGLAWYALTLRA